MPILGDLHISFLVIGCVISVQGLVLFLFVRQSYTLKLMLEGILSADKKLLEKIANGLSVMDKSAEIQRDKKGEIIYDKESKDTEIVKWEEDIETYMAREVLPHIPEDGCRNSLYKVFL